MCCMPTGRKHIRHTWLQHSLAAMHGAPFLLQFRHGKLAEADGRLGWSPWVWGLGSLGITGAAARLVQQGLRARLPWSAWPQPRRLPALSTAVVSFLLALPPPSAAAASALAVTSCHLPLLLQDAKPASRRRRQRRAEVLHQVPQPEGPRRLLEEQVRVPSVRGHHFSDAPQSSGQPDDHLALVTPFVRSMLAAVGCRIWAGVSHSAPGPST